MPTSVCPWVSTASWAISMASRPESIGWRYAPATAVRILAWREYIGCHNPLDPSTRADARKKRGRRSKQPTHALPFLSPSAERRTRLEPFLAFLLLARQLSDAWPAEQV